MTADTHVPIAGYQVEAPALRGRLGPILRAVRSTDATAVVVHVVAVPLPGPVCQRVVAEARERVGILPDHVVPLLDAGLDAGGRPYLVTPWLPAGSLAERLGTTGPMAVPAAMRAGVEAAQGLAELHRRGSVHGRVTPANLLADADGTVSVTGAVLPTLAGLVEPGPFDPPEGPGTPAADVYALAATIVTLIVGTPPRPDHVPDHPDLSVAARGVLGCA
ncbi:MAG TPA: protein kinase, partial [Cryptosporangiaceae bacterium]|nr:protein kinase [Cryptosporangiaceae bacterium]